MPVQRLTWRDGGREDTFINKTQIITKYCNNGQNACTAQNLKKKHKRLIAFKTIQKTLESKFWTLNAVPTAIVVCLILY